MGAESNDTAPVCAASARKIPTVAENYNRIKFASDVIA